MLLYFYFEDVVCFTDSKPNTVPVISCSPKLLFTDNPEPNKQNKKPVSQQQMSQ